MTRITTGMALADVSVTVPGTEDGPIEIRGLFTGEGLAWFTSNLGANFIGFPPLLTVVTILLAVTVAGIFASTRSHFRISGSTASTNDPRGGLRYTGGSSDASAARTVFRATPSLRTIALIGSFSALCNRRISAQSSTEITLQECRRGQDSNVATGSVFTRR